MSYGDLALRGPTTSYANVDLHKSSDLDENFLDFVLNGELPNWNWSDEYLNKLSNDIFFPKINDVRTQALVIYRFYQLYFDGYSTPTECPFVILSCVISLIPRDKSVFQFNRLFPSEEGKPFHEIGTLSAEIAPFKNLGTAPSFSSTCKSKFANAVVNTLTEAFMENDYTSDFLCLLRLTGYLGLKSLEFMRDDIDYTSYEAFKLDYKTIYAISLWKKDYEFMTPCPEFYSSLGVVLSKDEDKAHTLFTKVLNKYVTVRKNQENRAYLINVFNSGCMISLMCNGMECISLVAKARENLFVSLKTFKKHTFMQTTEESWSRHDRFVNKFLIGPNVEISALWARLVNQTFFSNLDGLSNVFLCGICAAIVEKCMQFSSVWDNEWCKEKEVPLMNSKRYGHALYEKFINPAYQIEFAATEEVKNLWIAIKDKELRRPRSLDEEEEIPQTTEIEPYNPMDV